MANKRQQSLMQRARWDRIIGALIILILLIVLLVSALKSCGKDKRTVDTNATPVNNSVMNAENTLENHSTIDADSAVIPTDVVVTEIPAETVPVVEDNSRAVFLSPSTQETNFYACDPKITEEDVMFELAERVSALLEEDGYKAYICSREDNVKAKVKQGNFLGCGAYVALHSNAGNDGPGGSGTECYYNDSIEGSEQLAKSIYDRVSKLTPTKDRGVKDQSQRDLYEILNNKYPCCFLEIEFHDNEEQSRWILDNMDGIAESVCEGIEEFLNSTDTSDIPATDKPITMNPEEVFGDEG